MLARYSLPQRLSSKVHARRYLLRVSTISAVACVTLVASAAAAQEAPTPTVPPERSEAWSQATTILAISALSVELVMPRVFYSEPEVTVGWKARWHLSALAPILTLATLTLVNEHYLKDSIAAHRPGCDDTNQGLPGCTSYGSFSSPTLATFSAVGHGAAVFFSDTTKWSDGRFNAGAFTGHVAVPLILAVITAAGRTSGNWESGAQVWATAGTGFALGVGTGLLYGLLQRPECGYSGKLICW